MGQSICSHRIFRSITFIVILNGHVVVAVEVLRRISINLFP